VAIAQHEHKRDFQSKKIRSDFQWITKVTTGSHMGHL
jgi:hypothetical protein